MSEPFSEGLELQIVPFSCNLSISANWKKIKYYMHVVMKLEYCIPKLI